MRIERRVKNDQNSTVPVRCKLANRIRPIRKPLSTKNTSRPTQKPLIARKNGLRSGLVPGSSRNWPLKIATCMNTTR